MAANAYAAARYTGALMPLRICFVSSEVAPLAKTGGLADVSGALPRQLRALGHDVRLFMPLYSGIDRTHLLLRAVEDLSDVAINLGALEYRFSILATHLPGSALPVYLIDCPAAFDRPALYTNSDDEHLRFLVLQRATLEACLRLKFAPHILQCNDWHTALLPLLLKTQYAHEAVFADTRTLLSIHNIGYQGHFSSSTIAHANLTKHATLLDATDLTHGHINWLKEGVRHAHRVATVSQTYAQEICAPIGGHGLDEALRARGDVIAGILNGVDYDEWNPAVDTHLPAQYSADDLSGKVQVKRALLQQLKLHVADSTPIIGMVSRLTPQKGFDLLFDALPEIVQQRELAVAVLGSGDVRYEDFFRQLAKRFPERVAFTQGYNEQLAHVIEAGSDMFLMPSMYEPCGLNQMYSLKYGTVPIVRRTGGLADSVQMWDGATNNGTGAGTGIVFNDFDVPAIRWALHTALDLFKDRNAWLTLMRNGMAQDFSWERQAQAYVALYESMLPKHM
jgi:starch synthase